jgi:hypothetical protein
MSYKGEISALLSAASARQTSDPFHTHDFRDSGEVLEIESPRRLVLKWRNEFRPELKAEGYSRLTYELEREGKSVKLTVIHEMEKEGSKFIQAVSNGWPHILSCRCSAAGVSDGYNSQALLDPSMSVNRKVTVPTGLCCIAPTTNPRLVEANAELAGLSHLALCEGRMDMEMRLSRGFLRANNLDCRRTSRRRKAFRCPSRYARLPHRRLLEK